MLKTAQTKSKVDRQRVKKWGRELKHSYRCLEKHSLSGSQMFGNHLSGMRYFLLVYQLSDFDISSKACHYGLRLWSPCHDHYKHCNHHHLFIKPYFTKVLQFKRLKMPLNSLRKYLKSFQKDTASEFCYSRNTKKANQWRPALSHSIEQLKKQFVTSRWIAEH